MDDEDVFEDAQEQPVIIVQPTINNNNNDRNTVSKKISGSSSPLPKIAKKLRPKFTKKQRTKTEEISLSEALEEAKTSVDLFLDNNFEEAKNICEPLADRSIYHALGYGVFMYLKAVMTFEQKHIEEASVVLSNACDTINGFRKKVGLAENLGRIVRKADYDSFTELELHAELCYAECLLLKAALTFCEDETLVSFVKAGLKVRTCYQSFRECWSALHQRDWSKDSSLKNDFESGVRLGVGGFNLMISLLPGRIMKLLEFIGFDGNRDAGLRELHLVFEDKSGMRHFLSCFVLLGYHLLLSYFIGSSECDLELCTRILDEKLEAYPEGAFFKFFKGRLHFVQGEVTEAIEWYTKSVKSQDDWPQFHHICYWELYWASMLSQRWREAISYSDTLLQESKWSRCMYAYLKASVMCMVQGELTEQERREQIQLMESVPDLKQRIAGKSLPMEKFAVKKAQRFLAQGNHLALPALELIYIWNNFRILGQQYKLVEPMFVLIEQTMKRLEQHKDSVPFYDDDYCLLNLLMAVCLKYMQSPLQAEECLKTVISHANQLKHDTYLVPYALFELALLMRDQGNLVEAGNLLESAKNDYKNYSLLSRLHFRIHAVQSELKKAQGGDSKKTKKNKKKAEAKEDEANESSSSSEGNSNSMYQDVDEVLPFVDTHEELTEQTLSEQEALKMLKTGN